MVLSPEFGAGGGAGEADDRGARAKRPEEGLRRHTGDERYFSRGGTWGAAPHHRPQRGRKDDAVQPDHWRPRTRCRRDLPVWRGNIASEVASTRPSRAGAHLPD